MSLHFTVGDRFVAAADEWAERRMTDADDALETKVEQALLEVEHLASGAHDVEFSVEDQTVTYDPTDELGELLDRQAAETGLDPDEVLKLHVDLFARAFLDDATEEERPPNAPPRD